MCIRDSVQPGLTDNHQRDRSSKCLWTAARVRIAAMKSCWRKSPDEALYNVDQRSKKPMSLWKTMLFLVKTWFSVFLAKVAQDIRLWSFYGWINEKHPKGNRDENFPVMHHESCSYCLLHQKHSSFGSDRNHVVGLDDLRADLAKSERVNFIVIVLNLSLIHISEPTRPY